MPERRESSWIVVKVGGSLYDLPDLRARLMHWLTQFPTERILLVPGGGSTADVIRTFDAVHALGEEAAHWLALRALSLNAHFLQALLPSAHLVDEIPSDSKGASPWYLLDAEAFFRADEQRQDHLPHHWEVTSDSLAVRVAQLAQARELFLLKSTVWHGTDWQEASQTKVVDAYFPHAVCQAGSSLQIRVVDLRALTMIV